MADIPPRRSKKRHPEKERIRSSDASSSLAFGKRTKRSLPRPGTPSELAFAAAEPLDSKPSAPSAAATASHSHVAGLLPYGAGLAVAAIFSFSIATAIIFARTSPAPVETESRASEIAAADPAQTTQAGEPLGGIRFVDPSAEALSPCEDAVWPYIDQRCFATAKGENNIKNEAKKDTKRNGKIGPKPIDSRSQPNPLANAQERNVPIGSLTAIAPAKPTVSTTDGVATGAPEVRIAETGPADGAKPAASKRRTHKSDKYVRTSEITDRTGSVVERTVVVKKKKVRQVADAGRRTSYRRAAAEAPETPSFFFPFGLFSQTR